MNRRKLGSLLQAHSKNRDRGFAVPTALMFGLAILLVSTSLIVRSQNDRVTASMQQATDSSLNAAESGITKIQAFLNENRSIAPYSLEQWKQASQAGSPMAGLFTGCGLTASEVTNFANTVTTWQNVDPTDATKGQYRLLRYTYSAAPGTTPGEGTLVVEGRTSNQQSTNRVQVVIPVQPGDVIGIPVPGVWVTNGGVGGNGFAGNVVLKCGTSTAGVNVTGNDPSTGQPYTVKNSPLDLPAPPPKPTTFNVLPATIDSDLTLPRLTGAPALRDTPTTKTINGRTVQVYEYVVDNLTVKNAELTIDPNYKVTFYARGSIGMQGTGLIKHSCVDSANRPIAGCAPTDFQIFGYDEIGSNNQICLSGRDKLEAFILAPGYEAGVAGAAGGEGGFRGAVWVGDWGNGGGCGSQTRNSVFEQTASWDSIGLVPQNLPPKITAPSAWQRVNP